MKFSEKSNISRLPKGEIRHEEIFFYGGIEPSSDATMSVVVAPSIGAPV